MLCLHNLAEDPRVVAVKVEDHQDAQAVDLFGGTDQQVIRGRLELTLEPYGYRWYRLVREGERPPP